MAAKKEWEGKTRNRTIQDWDISLKGYNKLEQDIKGTGMLENMSADPSQKEPVTRYRPALGGEAKTEYYKYNPTWGACSVQKLTGLQDKQRKSRRNERKEDREGGQKQCVHFYFRQGRTQNK